MDLKNTEVQENQAVEEQTAEQAVVSPIEQPTEKSVPVEKPHKKRKVLVIVIVCLLLLLILAAMIFYWRVATYYETHFFPNTTVNDLNCSELEANQVADMLDSRIQEYKLEVTGRLSEAGDSGILGEITAEDIDLHYVGNADAVNRLLEQQNEWMWIETLADKHYSHVLVQEYVFDEEMLAEYVSNWDAFNNMIKPQDAYISEYSEENGYEIIPETIGTQLDVETAMKQISNAVQLQEVVVDLEEADCYTKASLTAEDKELNESVEEVNRWLATEITYDWNGREIVVDKEMICDWISFDGNEPQLDEEAVAEFVAERAQELDTYGRNSQFTTTLGVQLTLQRKSYGWKTDTEGETQKLIESIYQGSIEDRAPIFISKGKWKGTNDIGNSYVEADLTNQHLYLYYQGTLVLETDFVSGDPNSPGCLSPAGIFGITYKTTNAVLRGQDYETPVSFWMPFYGNFGMHDATWRTEFGGDIYLTNGSHGCLNLPLDKAEAIYNYMTEGFPVICYYY